MIAPGLMLTNHHVVAARFGGEPPARTQDFDEQGARTQAWFDYVDIDKPRIVYGASTLEASDKRLDYALLRMSSESAEAPPLADWGWLRVVSDTFELTTGRSVNIIQHPAGDVKQIAIRRNEVVRGGVGDEFHYLTDTLPGSSGSPVLNDDWLVVGLHRASRNVPEKVYQGETIKYNNVGVRIHAVLAHLPAALREEIEQAGR
jgi:V8-like Glu-specific endopeptidase